MGGTKGKFYKLKVDKREREKNYQYFGRKSEKIRRTVGNCSSISSKQIESDSRFRKQLDPDPMEKVSRSTKLVLSAGALCYVYPLVRSVNRNFNTDGTLTL